MGFQYSHHSRKGEKQYWRCVERKLKDGTDGHINHKADHRSIEARKVMRGVKRAAEEHPNDQLQRVCSLHLIATMCHTRGIDDLDRVIALCSEESLRVLTWSETIYDDGMFKTVLNQDMQTYRKIWDAIKQEAERLNLRFKVRMFMTDLEIAAMNKQQAIFPRVEHKGCLFHFNQALWRQTLASGLKHLMALPFVPIPDLEENFDAVVDDIAVADPEPALQSGYRGAMQKACPRPWIRACDIDNRVEPLATTMDSTYLRGPNLRRRRVVPPRFSPALWNVHQQAVDDTARTNNVMEGWHSKFQRFHVVHHANVWKFVDEVIDESTTFITSSHKFERATST
ncbi:Protein salvador-like protein 1 [Frankliniella fusca]|uniref:Protein salvador-like protein 1 n=1 Tax=Frankliniella fusca TaxID=407009 RepID=A0AAE1H486_9NEOP|nr:Protein salvador-like protein 1 [Frankliniella fusca]